VCEDENRLLIFKTLNVQEQAVTLHLNFTFFFWFIPWHDISCFIRCCSFIYRWFPTTQRRQ